MLLKMSFAATALENGDKANGMCIAKFVPPSLVCRLAGY